MLLKQKTFLYLVQGALLSNFFTSNIFLNENYYRQQQASFFVFTEWVNCVWESFLGESGGKFSCGGELKDLSMHDISMGKVKIGQVFRVKIFNLRSLIFWWAHSFLIFSDNFFDIFLHQT